MPFYSYTGERERLVEWAVEQGPEGVAAYQREKNVRSIDGLPTPLTGTAPA